MFLNQVIDGCNRRTVFKRDYQIPILITCFMYRCWVCVNPLDMDSVRSFT